MHGAKSTPPEVRPHTAATSIPTTAATSRMPRRIRLRQEDFVEYGYTVGCPGCGSIPWKSSVRRGHNEECRARMEEELSKTDPGKEIMEHTKDRMDEKAAKMGEQAMQGQGGNAPEVTEFVYGPEESREDAATLLMMAGKPKLLERRKFEPTLAQDQCNCHPLGKGKNEDQVQSLK